MAGDTKQDGAWATRNAMAISIVGAMAAYAASVPIGLWLYFGRVFSDSLSRDATLWLVSAAQFFLSMMVALLLARRLVAPVGVTLRIAGICLIALSFLFVSTVIAWSMIPAD